MVAYFFKYLYPLYFLKFFLLYFSKFISTQFVVIEIFNNERLNQ